MKKYTFSFTYRAEYDIIDLNLINIYFSRSADMQSFNVDRKYDHILKELSEFIDLDSCEIVDKLDRLWVKVYFKNFDFEVRFSLNFNTVDFRLYFPRDPELAFNQNYKVWSEENMLQITEYYYHRAKQRRYMHEFIDDLSMFERSFKMSFTLIDTKRRTSSEKSEPSFLKIAVSSMLIAVFMTLLIISGLFPSMIKFAEPYAVAIFSFMSLFNTIMFLIFDE